MIVDVTGVLLAGGKSRRMGEDKRYLHVGERTLFERGLEVLRTVFSDVLVVIAADSEPLDIPVRVLRDVIPHCGSLGGLFTGLREAKTPYAFVVACDMPFLSIRTIEAFVDRRHQVDVVMARNGRSLQPLHAVYGKRCLPVVEGMIRAGDLKIQHLVDNPLVHVRLVEEEECQRIDPTGKSFMNVNTPGDLDAARALEARDHNGSSPR